MTTELWLPPPSHLDTSCATIHVWRAALDTPLAALDQLARLLSPDERERAARFTFVRDRCRFVIGRGILRAILGLHLNTDGQSLQFHYGSHGKPALVAAPDRMDLRFSVAHSGGVALYALAMGREIGIDLEAIRPLDDAEKIAAYAFSQAENAALARLPRQLWLSGFYNCWTRKEAYVKARGLGLALPLDRFDVSLAPGDPPLLIAVRDEPAEASRWTLHDLLPGPGYVGALAAEGEGWNLARWEWDGDLWAGTRATRR